MVKRTRIISDPADFVPLLRIFLFTEYRRIFEELSNGWKTEEELRRELGEDVKDGLHILMRCGLLESRWRAPEPGKKPVMEYHTSYSNVVTNFQCSLKEFADLVDVAYMDDKQFEYLEKPVMDLIAAGRNSINAMSKTLDLSVISLKAIVKRSHRMCIRGHKIEIVKGN
ncbi:ArsR family transcriptional regulator [Candidatus Alkanophaga liquidiphilum]